MSEVQKSRTDYRKLMMQLVDDEERERKVFLLAEEVSRVEKLKEEAAWKRSKEEMDSDPTLSAELLAIDKSYGQGVEAVTAKFAAAGGDATQFRQVRSATTCD
jgi:hypothetical protein